MNKSLDISSGSLFSNKIKIEVFLPIDTDYITCEISTPSKYSKDLIIALARESVTKYFEGTSRYVSEDTVYTYQRIYRNNKFDYTIEFWVSDKW